MYELLRKGQLSATTSDIADYLPYTAVKFAELLESSAIMYDNEYRKLQCEYGFRWGSDSQHLHIRFLVKRRSSVLRRTTGFGGCNGTCGGLGNKDPQNPKESCCVFSE